jgi:hypothetical protein
MSGSRSLVRSLFAAPGQAFADPAALLRRAASAYAALLSLAMKRDELADSLAPIGDYLDGSASAARKRRVLCHPLFVEGLHALAPFSSELQTWHDSVAPRPRQPTTDAAAAASLGNVALALRLRVDRGWCGRCDCCTDLLGRLGFPFCDWTFRLCSETGLPLAHHAVSLTLDHDRACWRLGDEPDHPFLVMPRADCERMLIDRDAELDGRRLRFPDSAVQIKITCAGRLGRSNVRYDPVAFAEETDHAAVAGGLIARVVEAIRDDSPAVYREFRTYVRTVRGYEFPRAAGVASFSDPTMPGVMSVSVACTDDGEPCLDPFCFTWFGHEMGHTKDYHSDTILYVRGESLVSNGGDWSAPIPRYGRPLAVRTIIQVPYVHLYEWELLMDFCEAEFRGLPWRVAGGAGAVGDGFAAEIEESFDLIDEYARLTPIGAAAVSRFRQLFDRSKSRWRSLHVTT